MNSILPRLAAIAALLTGFACATSEPETAPVEPIVDRGPTAPEPRFERIAVIGESVEGRPIVSRTFGTGPDVALLIATIHGNEAAGTPLLERLQDELRRRPELTEGRTVVVVAVANPDGRAGRRRTNARGVDLNRNFEARNFRAGARRGASPLSEPESRALRDLILRVRPMRVVSIHQPVACVDWDGPAEELARAMAGVCGLEARRIGSRPGSMGSWVGLDLEIPIITFELPRDADRLTASALWTRYGPAVRVAVSGVASRAATSRETSDSSSRP